MLHGLFKHVKGQDGTPSFLPLDSKIGGTVTYMKDREAICLTEGKTRYVYKNVEQGSD